MKIKLTYNEVREILLDAVYDKYKSSFQEAMGAGYRDTVVIDTDACIGGVEGYVEFWPHELIKSEEV